MTDRFDRAARTAPSTADLNTPTAFTRADLHQPITARFERIVAAGATRAAIRSDNWDVSYGMLNRAANGVAHSLLQWRGDAAEPVGLLFDHDHRAISAMLGVLKAGRFYVPLDPSYPPERLSFIADDCGAPVVFTDAAHLALARTLAPSGCEVVLLDDCQQACADNPSPPISPDSIAAIFYTSGSTGQPKGVVQTHRLVLHRVLIDVQSFGIGRDDRLTLLSSPSYSNSLRHVFGALLNGATLCPFNLVERGAAEFIAWLERERITIYDSVPAVFRRWTSALPHTDALRALRVLHLGGDGPTAADFEMFRTHVPDGCRFVTTLASNEAGPFRRFLADRTTQITGDVVPVGYAVDDKDVLIVDDDGRALDANRVGEIVVSSAFLSPGYWGRPDLTAAAFRPDPRDPQKRVYRTGDLGAIRPDGCLLFKGRKESRTKIRGVRVEIAEIEAALGAHPNVDRSIVVARQQAANEDSLVAYVVTTTGAALTVSELRHFLAARVPNQSIPSAFVFLHELQLGPNGKVDRLALPAPDGLRPQLTTRYAAPQDALERRLAATCEAVLGIRPIGVHDNLLDLGADSLTLLQLTARIEDEFGTPLPPASLFAAPTLAKLATKLRTGSVPARCSSLVPVTTTGHRTPFFWIHGDYSTALLPGYLGADQPLYAFEHQSQDGTAAEHTEVETIAAYYAAAMRAVQAAGPYLIGGYSFGGVLALEIAHQLTSEGERVALLALLDPPSLSWSRWTNPIPVETASSGPESITHRVRRHLNGLGSLSAGERVEYFRSRIWEKSVDHLRQIQRQAYTAIYRAHFMLDLRLPRFVRRPYVFDLYGRAYGRYAVRPYSGPAILFKGEGRRYYSAPEWDELLTGPREVHRLATAHNDMPSKKNIHLWAETLTRALARAQAENAVK